MTETLAICPFEQNPDGQYLEKLSNHLFDYIMPTLSPTAWMVLCFIIRKTTGWRKDSDDLSIGDIKKGTGIKTDATVVKAIAELEEKEYVLVIHRKETRQANTYALNTTLIIEVVSTSKNKVDSKTTLKNEVETTLKNEVESGLTTSKNIDTKEQYLKDKEKEHAPNYLSQVFNGQGKVSELTGDNPDDQWLDYRDKALKAFPGEWGRTAKERQIKKDQIAGFVAEAPDFDPDHWEFIIQDCIAHGVSSNNIARFIEAYPFEDYEAYLASKYPKLTNGRDSPGKVHGKLKQVVRTSDGGFHV